MAVKKYLSLERLSEYDALIKTEIAEGDESVKSYVDTELAKKANSSHSHDDKYYTETEIDTKISGINSTITTHTGNTTVHITAGERTNWNAAKTHADSSHAPSNAERNIIVGIQRNGTDLTVDSSTRKINIAVPTTAAEIGAATSGHKHDDLYDAKGAASSALDSAKTYADSAATKVKNDLLNGAGAAYDTLKELGELIDNNKDAIDALEDIASGKANATHSHAISDVTGLQTALDGKAASSHGTHVSYSTTAPVMDGTASVGTASTVARSDHKHPTDTSRASQADLDALEAVVAGKAPTSHNHTVANITDLTATATELNYMDGVTSSVQAQLDSKAASGHGHDAATTSADGFMTAAMVTKLNGIATGANKTTVDTALSSSSTNPVQNKVVNSAITTLTSSVSANTSSITTHTTAITNLQTAVSEIQEITSAEIQALFA